MAQFDVYRNADASSRNRFPLLLDIQARMLEDLATRVVVPLAAVGERSVPPITRLMPLLELDGKRFVMHTPELAGIAHKTLGQQVGSMAAHRAEIVAALDVLVRGV